MTTAEATGRRLQSIPIDQINDNPWQPRQVIDPAALQELAEDIAAHGLLQPPMVRAIDPERWATAVAVGLPGGYTARFELAFGHRRVAAMRSLGWTHLECEVREISDERMAVIALSENSKRVDLKPIEEYRAWKKALEEIEGLTVLTLAEQLGRDRSTVTNNLRLLQLPDQVLRYVDSGELSAHGAREFLCLLGADGHFHADIAGAVMTKLLTGTPDWRVARIRWELDQAIENEPVAKWRKLFTGNYVGIPTFDVAEFERANGACVHTIPHDTWTGYSPSTGKVKEEGSRNWTCATSAWSRAQDRAKKAAPTPAAKSASSATSDHESRSKDFAKTLARDPVYRRVSGETPKQIGDAKLDPALREKQVREQLGTRAEPALLTKAGFKACVDTAYADAPYGSNVTDVPTFLHNPKECRETCVSGATWAHFSESQPLKLYCLNEECFNAKCARGREPIERKFEPVMAALDEQQARAVVYVQPIAGEYAPESVLRLVTAEMLAGGSVVAEVPRGVDYRDQRHFARWPANVARILELLGVDLEPRTNHTWFGAEEVKRLEKLSFAQIRELLPRLLVNRAWQNDVLVQRLKSSLPPIDMPRPEPVEGKRQKAAAGAAS